MEGVSDDWTDPRRKSFGGVFVPTLAMVGVRMEGVSNDWVNHGRGPYGGGVH